MRIHLIAIGGAVMHNLAIALKEKGEQVSGSDDEIRDPSRTRLEYHGLLPETLGWNPDRMKEGLDAVIVGMHARKDNPELLRALEIGLPVYSFPEFVYQNSVRKKRVVIAGSHGKTTTTSMIMHGLKVSDFDFDYLVGAQLEGFSTMVKLSKAPMIILEGDEYLSSPLDPSPKFLHYKPDVLVLTGIAWDHINVFPTFENYLKQFELLLGSLEDGAEVLFFEEDAYLQELIQPHLSRLKCKPYNALVWKKGKVAYSENEFDVKLIGRHNFENMSAAMEVCALLGLAEESFLETMSTYSGAAKRMEVVASNSHSLLIRDFAHAPSKVRATVDAVHEAYGDKEIIAILELHTFSSLSKEFLNEYDGALKGASKAYVFYDPATVKHKRLPTIEPYEVKKAFNSDVIVYNKPDDLRSLISRINPVNQVLLLMSSGGLAGTDLQKLAKRFK